MKNRTYFGRGFILCWTSFCGFLYSLGVDAKSNCVIARSHTASSCENLIVKFDFSRCPEKRDPSNATVVCLGSESYAILKTQKYHYKVDLIQTSDGWNQGKWNVHGKVKTLSRSPASGDIPDALLPPLTQTLSVPHLSVEPAPRADSSSLTVTGSARLRIESNRKTDYLSDRTFSLLRMRTDIRWNPQPNVSLFVQPQFARALGEASYSGASTTSNAIQQTSGTTIDPSLSIHQAYVEYSFNPNFQFIGGRQILSYGDEMLVGALEWNNVGRSFDALKLRSKYEWGSTDLFATKLIDSNVYGPGFGDKDFYGLYHHWIVNSWMQNLDLYGFYLNDEIGVLPSSLWTIGSRVKSTIESIDYRLEVTQQWGQQANPNNGNQANAELGITLSTALKPRISVEGFYASPNFNQLFPTFHKWLGYADVLGRRNISGLGVHTSASVTSSWIVALDYFMFERVSQSDPAYKLNGVTPLGSSRNSNNTSIGSEWDLTVKYQVNSKLNILGGGSVFLPGNYLKDQLGDQQPLFYFLQTEATF